MVFCREVQALAEDYQDLPDLVERDDDSVDSVDDDQIFDDDDEVYDDDDVTFDDDEEEQQIVKGGFIVDDLKVEEETDDGYVILHLQNLKEENMKNFVL